MGYFLVTLTDVNGSNKTKTLNSLLLTEVEAQGNTLRNSAFVGTLTQVNQFIPNYFQRYFRQSLPFAVYDGKLFTLSNGISYIDSEAYSQGIQGENESAIIPNDGL